jgi:hypothetical protein
MVMNDELKRILNERVVAKIEASFRQLSEGTEGKARTPYSGEQVIMLRFHPNTS